MKVLVAGATGQTGRRIVEQLVAKNIATMALVRDLEKAQSLLPQAVEFVVGDVLQPETLAKAIAPATVIISATGASPSFDPTGPYKVDYEGTKNLIDAAKAQSIQHFVMVSSLCTSQFFHPLNLFWLVLHWKKQAEEYLQASGLNYTIVRPGGLKNEDNNDAVVMAAADTLSEGSIPRSKVAQTCIESLFQRQAQNKIVEIVARPEAPEKPWPDLFASVV
ncbi:MAG: SDR family oxidoreductase [Jaaginema sp. PMC 1079.18]|nr:SDR family oxidoreductase [Jaaginema sp. PMC 1080.18]MEC4850238.1 SDR family oxidoreductase [Jaaginema sp. PMC 1079.18]MEC4867298.1 SDR family oxidoreductase [Jaaginema sp. PMC 1078.18]